jgi:hypothetical protein
MYCDYIYICFCDKNEITTINNCDTLIVNVKTFKNFTDLLAPENWNLTPNNGIVEFKENNTVLFMTNIRPKKIIYSTKNNILIYTGFCDKLWNETYMKNNALGKSETSVVHIVKSLPKNYNIYIVGNVGDELIIARVHHSQRQQEHKVLFMFITNFKYCILIIL